jgi:hypothetical protein
MSDPEEIHKRCENILNKLDQMNDDLKRFHRWMTQETWRMDEERQHRRLWEKIRRRKK